MEPNTQPGTPTEQPVMPETALNNVPDAIEPDTTHADVIQPAAPVEASFVTETAQPVTPFSSIPVPVAAPAVTASPVTAPVKKKSTLILIVVLGVLALAAVGVIVYVTTMS